MLQSMYLADMPTTADGLMDLYCPGSHVRCPRHTSTVAVAAVAIARTTDRLAARWFLSTQLPVTVGLPACQVQQAEAAHGMLLR